MTRTLTVRYRPRRDPPWDVRYAVDGQDAHLPARDLEELYEHLSLAFARFQGLPAPRQERARRTK